MVEIQPYEFKKKTNIEEHNDIVSKVNEIVDVINDTQMDTIDSRLTAVEGDVTTLENEIDTVQSDISEIENKNAEQDSAISDNTQGLITASELSYAEGVLTLKLTKQNGNLTETVDVPFFKTVTLIPTSTDRAFKLQFTMWDESVYDTNEFVIPAGGGTDISVTGVTIGEGASDNSFKVTVQLSDASTIASNDYPFPASITNPYPTNVTLSLSGNTLNCNIALSDSNHVDGSVDLTTLFASYATQQWVTGQLANYVTNEALNVKITALKLTSSGNTMSINGTSANIINSISGQVTDGNLRITINGVESGDIPFDKDFIDEIDFTNENFTVTATSGLTGEYKLEGTFYFNENYGEACEITYKSTKYLKIKGFTKSYTSVYGSGKDLNINKTNTLNVFNFINNYLPEIEGNCKYNISCLGILKSSTGYYTYLGQGYYTVKKENNVYTATACTITIPDLNLDEYILQLIPISIYIS